MFFKRGRISTTIWYWELFESKTVTGVVAIYAVDCVVQLRGARKRRRPASAAELAPHIFAVHVRPKTSSHTAAALSLVLSHCSHSPFLSSYTNTSTP
jgi:hypothetical protein